MARGTGAGIAGALREMKPRMRASFLIAALLVALSLCWAIFVSRPTLNATASPLDRLESTLLDARYATFGPIDPSPDVVLVAVNDRTLDVANERFPDNRRLLAAIVRAIAEADPKVLGLDIILADGGDPDADAALASALTQTNSVIAAAARYPDDPGTKRALPLSVLKPQERFLHAATSGLVNLSTDTGGTPRYVPMIFRTSQGVEPAFALQIAARFLDASPVLDADALRLGDRVVPLDTGLNMPLRLAGPTGTIATYSASDVLSGDVKAELSGKAVILGYTATAFGDRFPNPFDDSIPGAEIMATVVSQILGAQTLRRNDLTRRTDALASGALAVLATVLVVSLPLSTGVPLALLGIATWMIVVWYAFSSGVWLSGSTPLVSALIPLLIAVGWRYFGERRAAAKGAQTLAALKRFQSPALADMIANDPAFLKHASEHHLSVFFVDLSGFTKLSEKLGPTGTQDLLKRFHQVTAHTIEAQGGIVLNYMGDGALAIFGLTGDAGLGANRALQAAFDLVRDIGSLGPALGPDLHVRCRVGVHHGEVILSRLGGDRHHQVSVAGDTVNLASRLLEIAKAQGAVIAATQATLMIADHPPAFPPQAMMPTPIRGRENIAQVHFWMQQDLN